MSAQARNEQCVTLRSAQAVDLPKVLDLLGRSDLPSAGVVDALSHFVVAENEGRLVFLLTTTAEHYFPRFGFACVSRDSVADAVKASPEFKGACPASAIAMRKSL